MGKKLSRRDFLKLSGTVSLSAVLSGCGLSQVATVTPTSTITLSPTLTLTPLLTATATPLLSMEEPAVPIPNSDDFPNIDIQQLQYEKFVDLRESKLSDTEAIEVWAWGQDPNNPHSSQVNVPMLVAKYSDVEKAWRWSRPEIQDLADRIQGIGGTLMTHLRMKDGGELQKMLEMGFNGMFISAEAQWWWKWDEWIKDLRPSKDQFDFSQLDQAVKIADNGKREVLVNGLVWGAKEFLPPWLLNGSFGNSEILQIVENHIRTVAGRYADLLGGKHVKVWVVNEPTGPWNWFTDERGISKADYIDTCLNAASQTDSDAEIMVNEFGIEFGGEKASRFHNLVKTARERGTPLNSVGFQCHFEAKDFLGDGILETKMSRLQNTIKQFQELGVTVSITELDVIMEGVTTQPGEPLAELQKRIYKAIVQTCLAQGVKRIYYWGENDRFSSDPGASLLDTNSKPKPAYYGVIEAYQEYVASAR